MALLLFGVRVRRNCTVGAKDEAVGQVTHTLLIQNSHNPLRRFVKKLKLDGKWSGELVIHAKMAIRLLCRVIG